MLLVLAVLAAPSGCGGKAPTSQTSAQATTPAYEQVIRDYWAAFNAYDLEKCVSYLDPAYAETRRKGIESELDQFKFGKVFGIKMVVDSVSAQATMADGRLDVRVTMKISPGGFSDDRYLIYSLVQSGGVWKIARQRDDPDKTPPHSEPENLEVESVSATQVKLVWEEVSSRETGVRVERSPNALFEVDLVTIDLPENSSTYTDTTVTPGVTYYYRVRVFNKAGASDPSARVKVAVPAS